MAASPPRQITKGNKWEALGRRFDLAVIAGVAAALLLTLHYRVDTFLMRLHFLLMDSKLWDQPVFPLIIAGCDGRAAVPRRILMFLLGGSGHRQAFVVVHCETR